jgi:hypothetical protein
MTRDEEQLERALTGILSSAGVDGRPVNAGRWRTHEDLLLALDHARVQWSAGARPSRGVFRVMFGTPIGDGFVANCNVRVSTSHAMVIVRKGVTVTAFPVINPDVATEWAEISPTLK